MSWSGLLNVVFPEGVTSGEATKTYFAHAERPTHRISLETLILNRMLTLKSNIIKIILELKDKYPVEDVIKAINTLLPIAPTLAGNREAFKSVINEYLAKGGFSSFDYDQLMKLERNLSQRQEAAYGIRTRAYEYQ